MKTTSTSRTGLNIVHEKDGSITVTSKKLNKDYNSPLKEMIDGWAKQYSKQ